MTTIIRLENGWDNATVRTSIGDGATDTRMVSQVCRRRFALTPLDFCARYWLHVESAPGPLTVVLRGEVVAHGIAAGTPVDVTDFVSLDDNLLELSTPAEGDLGAVWLQALPCDD